MTNTDNPNTKTDRPVVPGQPTELHQEALDLATGFEDTRTRSAALPGQTAALEGSVLPASRIDYTDAQNVSKPTEGGAERIRTGEELLKEYMTLKSLGIDTTQTMGEMKPEEIRSFTEAYHKAYPGAAIDIADQLKFMPLEKRPIWNEALESIRNPTPEVVQRNTSQGTQQEGGAEQIRTGEELLREYLKRQAVGEDVNQYMRDMKPEEIRSFVEAYKKERPGAGETDLSNKLRTMNLGENRPIWEIEVFKMKERPQAVERTAPQAVAAPVAPEPIREPVKGGEQIEETAARALAQARESNKPVSFKFSNNEVVVRPDQTTEEVVKSYFEAIEKRREAYRQSPEGRAEEARRQAELAKPLSAEELRTAQQLTADASEAMKNLPPEEIEKLRPRLEALQKALEREANQTGTAADPSARAEIERWNSSVLETVKGESNQERLQVSSNPSLARPDVNRIPFESGNLEGWKNYINQVLEGKFGTGYGRLLDFKIINQVNELGRRLEQSVDEGKPITKELLETIQREIGGGHSGGSFTARETLLIVTARADVGRRLFEIAKARNPNLSTYEKFVERFDKSFGGTRQFEQTGRQAGIRPVADPVQTEILKVAQSGNIEQIRALMRVQLSPELKEALQAGEIMAALKTGDPKVLQQILEREGLPEELRKSLQTVVDAKLSPEDSARLSERIRTTGFGRASAQVGAGMGIGIVLSYALGHVLAHRSDRPTTVVAPPAPTLAPR